MSNEPLTIHTSWLERGAGVLPHLIGLYAIAQLMHLHVAYSGLLVVTIAGFYHSFIQGRHKTRILTIKPRMRSGGIWHITYEKGPAHSIEIISYYRSFLLIILIYRPLHQSRLCRYVFFKDALSSKAYSTLTRALLAYPK